MFTLSQIQPQLKLADELDRLREENARLREALKKYANPETHSMDPNGFVWSGDYFDYETARAALEGK